MSILLDMQNVEEQCFTSSDTQGELFDDGFYLSPVRSNPIVLNADTFQHQI